MTISEFDTFENEFMGYLKKDSKKCLKMIPKNSKLIENYLYGSDLTNVIKFVKDFNEAVLNPNVTKYKLFENILKESLFSNVLAQFRQSTVLVDACKNCNKNAAKWLLTMDINYGVQDESGKTALMYAVKFSQLFFVADKIIKTNGKHINIGDNNGNTALFYAVENWETLKNIYKYKEYFDVNHLNNKNENLITFSARNRRIKHIQYFETLTKFGCKDGNLTNTLGKTAAMYLAENGRYKELRELIKHYNIDPNYVNEYGNCLVSCFVKGYREYFTERILDKEGFGYNLERFKSYAIVLRDLVESHCNFNVKIDETGDNIIAILSKLRDETSSQYLLEKECVEFLVEKPYEKYYVDDSDPIVAENLKSVKMWLNEVYHPEGTINSHVLGVLLNGHNVNSPF